MLRTSIVTNKHNEEITEEVTEEITEMVIARIETMATVRIEIITTMRGAGDRVVTGITTITHIMSKGETITTKDKGW